MQKIRKMYRILIERLLVKLKSECGDNIKMSLREMGFGVSAGMQWFAIYMRVFIIFCFSSQVRLGCMCQ
jgi:hypothetical protein